MVRPSGMAMAPSGMADDRQSVDGFGGVVNRRAPCHSGGMTSKHRVAIVGLGMALGPHLRSLEALDRRVEIAACYSPTPARLAAFAGRHRWPVVADLDAI